MTNDSALTDSEIAVLRGAGYLPMGGGVDGDRIVVKFALNGAVYRATRAEWRAIIAELPKPVTMHELQDRLAASLARERRLREAAERYSEMHCAYIDGIPVACPGILVDGFACMACAMRAALAEEANE